LTVRKGFLLLSNLRIQARGNHEDSCGRDTRCGEFLHFHWDDEQLRQHLLPDDPFDVRLARPLNVHLEVYRRPDHIRIEGRLLGTLGFTCHRCLKGFTESLDEAVNVFLYEQQKAPEQEETQLARDDLSYEFTTARLSRLTSWSWNRSFLPSPSRSCVRKHASVFVSTVAQT